MNRHWLKHLGGLVCLIGATSTAWATLGEDPTLGHRSSERHTKVAGRGFSVEVFERGSTTICEYHFKGKTFAVATDGRPVDLQPLLGDDNLRKYENYHPAQKIKGRHRYFHTEAPDLNVTYSGTPGHAKMVAFNRSLFPEHFEESAIVCPPRNH